MPKIKENRNTREMAIAKTIIFIVIIFLISLLGMYVTTTVLNKNSEIEETTINQETTVNQETTINQETMINQETTIN